MRHPHAILLLSVLLVAAPCLRAQESPEVLPKVVQHAEPVYPPIARTAHIQGEVRVKITTDGQSVLKAEPETGPPLLWRTSVDNARTWKFVAHTPGIFRVTFRYTFLSGGVEVKFLESPAVVEVATPPGEMSVYYASIGLGEWKAQLKSPHGTSSQVFKLFYSGPDGDWLDGSALGPKGETEEIDFGHKEGNFLAFTITVGQPDGQHVKTFLIGKMTANRIVGTFVDDAGIRGTWEAVQVRPK